MDDVFDSINQINHIFNCNGKITQDFDVLNEPTPQENNISNDILWEYIDDPSPNNDVSKLFNNNGIKPKAAKNKRITLKPATGIKDGMLTKEIKQISKISPAAKYLISCYFKHKCLVFDDVIIPECVEILTIIYLAHPAFIHFYLGDENARPLQQSHKLFVIFGYHTLDILIDEFFKSQAVISAVRREKKKETKHYQTDHDSILNELFNVKIDEKERRIWRRDIKMAIPPYNGSYREIFDHIDELFFEYDAVPNNMVQYNDWDDFLGIDEAKKHKKMIDDEWIIVVDSIDTLFDTKNGLSEVEILIEQKDVLSDWVRDYKPPHEPWLDSLLNLPFQYKRKPKDIANKKILNLKDYK